jgi:hypothetical protein
MAFEDQFREDIAAQLRGLGKGDVTVSPDRAVLDVESAGEGVLRVVAGLNEDHLGRPGWANWVQLRIETEDRITPLLTLAWRDVEGDGGIGSLEARVNPDLPLEARGLNAAADIRDGKYRRGDVLDRLCADLDAVSGHSAARSSRALVRTDAARHEVAAWEPIRGVSPGQVVDAEFEPVVSGKRWTPSPDELKEMLIAEIFEALQHDLLSREAAAVGRGALASAKAHVLEAIEWAMLGTAYAVDIVTSRTAIGTFLPGESWLYGLVGPVLIGGLGSLAKEKDAKVIAFGLMTSWALFVGLVTASDETYLNGAQGWFPKGETVRTHEQALNLARLDYSVADKEVTRLEGKTGVNVTAAFAEAKRRWQAQEIRKAAEAGKREETAALETAKAIFKEAAGSIVREESALKKAMLEDWSRVEAWGALFAIFTLINFAGPYGISRVLGKWRREHVSAKADAEVDHHAREVAKLLRGSRGAQKARAMRLYGAAMEKLGKDGIASDLLNQINGADIARMPPSVSTAASMPENTGRRCVGCVLLD